MICKQSLHNLVIKTTPQIFTLFIEHFVVRDTIEGDPIVDPCGNKKPLILDYLDYHGNITSPNYPGTYPANVDCLWEIHARDGEAIVLTFHFLQTEMG